jgi:hypothetical protein
MRYRYMVVVVVPLHKLEHRTDKAQLWRYRYTTTMKESRVSVAERVQAIQPQR